MFRITSSQRTKIVLLGVALVAVIAATAFGQIRLNAWNQPFYDALARKASHGFVVQLRCGNRAVGVEFWILLSQLRVAACNKPT